MGSEHEIFKISRLIAREKSGRITEPEKDALDEWCKSSKRNARLYARYQDPGYFRDKFAGRDEGEAGKAFLRFSAQTDRIEKKRRLKIRFAYAAAVCILPLLTLVFVLQNNDPAVTAPVQYTAIQPGTTKALLILGDGKEVELTGQNGKLAEAGSLISMDSSGISYRDKEKTTVTTVMNTIRIPHGGEYKLSLSDSTRVWLNSETEIRFPVHFTGNVREVYVKGEAYFEVVRNPARPFIVKTDIARVEVLGTSFNVRQYSDENAMVTTLVEGRVRLAGRSNVQAVLRPGQQSVIGTDSKDIRVSEVDVTKYTAWKEGRFAFSGQTLGEIMNMLARWYDIDYKFDSEATRSITFTGDLKRYDDFSEIIRMLELTRKIKCEVTGNQIFIREAGTDKE